ncbi:MAG: L,D-transpeptidase [Myxococcales bacterium]|nr:L,D-transpeptidase [Myxococcales bacterium]
MTPRARTLLTSLALASALASAPWAAASLPPWLDPDDVPLPAGVRTAVPKKDELFVFLEPSRSPVRRGTIPFGSRALIFGTKRGPGCVGRWLLVGPLGWACSDQALFSDEPPEAAPLVAKLEEPGGDGLPYRYYFVTGQGAFAWDRIERVADDAPDQELEPGFAIAAVEERTAFGERYIKTSKGRFVPLRDLAPAHPSGFSGEHLAAGAGLDFGWVVVDRATVRATPSAAGKALGSRVRFERVEVRELRGKGVAAWARVSKDGEAEAWLPARELARPSASPRPTTVGDDERWIDVELASQTLVAYAGDRPLFATLVSTGRGPQGSETATPRGEHRVWVKLATSTMDNLERRDDLSHAGSEDGDPHVYSLDDVPYVQFFDKAVALHGVFWHRNFGRVQSHGCVNLSPKDARFLFSITLPRLPRGWSAALPVASEPGTLVRVR